MPWNRKTTRKDRKKQARSLRRDVFVFVEKLIEGSRKGGWFILLDKRTGCAFSPAHGCYAWEKSSRAMKALHMIGDSCSVSISTGYKPVRYLTASVPQRDAGMDVDTPPPAVP